MNRRSLLAGAALTALFGRGALASFAPVTKALYNALDYNILGDGATNDAAAINTFLTTVSTAGGTAFFPGGKTYNLGSLQIIVPDALTVMCGLGATFARTADQSGATPYGTSAGAMISVGNRCRWSGGILNNSAVAATSSTSNTIGTGVQKTFTVPAGLPWTASTFVRIWSRGTPAAHYEGVLDSYSGTTMKITPTFAGGSGTFTDWNITYGAVFQCPLVLHSVVGTTVENVRVTGNWYVGLLMEGFNVPAGGSSLTWKCAFRNCSVESVQNRGIYLYGNASDNLIEGCFIDGGSGTTDYGMNMNPANVSGSANAASRNKVINCDCISTSSQGFDCGDLSVENLFANCTVKGVTAASGIGFLIQAANAGTPQYNKIVNCIADGCLTAGFEFGGALYGGAVGCAAISCGEGYLITSSGGVQSQNVALVGCEAIGNTTNGVEIVGNSVRCDVVDIKSLNNSGTGILIDAGAVRTLVTGRSFNNTTANLTDGGTSSVTTGLTVA